jgi:hypothetical protein
MLGGASTCRSSALVDPVGARGREVVAAFKMALPDVSTHTSFGPRHQFDPSKLQRLFIPTLGVGRSAPGRLRPAPVLTNVAKALKPRHAIGDGFDPASRPSGRRGEKRVWRIDADSARMVSWERLPGFWKDTVFWKFGSTYLASSSASFPSEPRTCARQDRSHELLSNEAFTPPPPPIEGPVRLGSSDPCQIANGSAFVIEVEAGWAGYPDSSRHAPAMQRCSAAYWRQSATEAAWRAQP